MKLNTRRSLPSIGNLFAGVLFAILTVALYLYWLTGPILDLSEYNNYGMRRWHNYRLVDSGNRLIYYSESLNQITSIDLRTGSCKHIHKTPIGSLDLVNQRGECAVRTKRGVDILDLATGKLILRRSLPSHWEIKRLDKHRIVVEARISTQSQMNGVQVAVVDLDQTPIQEIPIREFNTEITLQNNYLFLEDNRLFFAARGRSIEPGISGHLFAIDGQTSKELATWMFQNEGERLDWVQRSSKGLLTLKGHRTSRYTLELRSIDTGELLDSDVTPEGYIPTTAVIRPSYLNRASISWVEGKTVDFVKLHAQTPTINASGPLPTAPPDFVDTKTTKPWMAEYAELIDMSEDGSLALFGATGFTCMVADVSNAKTVKTYNFKRDVSFASLAPNDQLLLFHWNYPIDICVKICDAKTGQLHRTIRPLLFWQLLLASIVLLAITSTVLIIRHITAYADCPWALAIAVGGIFLIAVLMRFEVAFDSKSWSRFGFPTGFLGGCLYAVIASFATLVASAIIFGRGRFAVKFLALELVHLTFSIISKDTGFIHKSLPQDLQHILFAFPLVLLILFMAKLVGVHAIESGVDRTRMVNVDRQFSMIDILLMMTAVSLFLFIAAPFSANFNSNVAEIANTQLFLYLVPVCLIGLYCGFSRQPIWLRMPFACFATAMLLVLRFRYLQSRNFSMDEFLSDAVMCVATALLTWLMVLPFRYRGVRLVPWRRLQSVSVQQNTSSMEQ